MARWVSLKFLDGNESIIQSIENNLGINYRDKKVQESINKARDILKKDNITEKNFVDNIVNNILKQSENICKEVITYNEIKNKDMSIKIDKILTSKIFGIPIMLAMLGVIFWITIVGANYPSTVLTNFFNKIENYLFIALSQAGVSSIVKGILIEGMFRTTAWVIAVMLPPMAIFFPLFSILEDMGYLPRVAFNMDGIFKKVGTSGKQALTMCMGFGCNAVGVTGCRIIETKREKLIAMLTNSLIPCNGRFPLLIAISSIFIGSMFAGRNSSIISTITVLLLVTFGIIMTLIISKFLSATFLKGKNASFVMELPSYRKPQLIKVIIRTIWDKIIFVLFRAIVIAAPAGIVIWLFANINVNGLSILSYIASFLDPLRKNNGA